MSKGEGPVKKVLVVDDEDSLRSSIGKILSLQRFEVSLAADVEEALERIAAEAFDLVLTDLRMPGPGDGLTVIQAARSRNPEVVAILMSAYASLGPPTVDPGMRPDAIVPKPFSIPSLLKLIRTQLDMRRSEPTPLLPVHKAAAAPFVVVQR